MAMQYHRTEYPRPQFRRENWLSLNGEWEFTFDDDQNGETQGYPSGKVALDKKIIVPFAYQTPASGIDEKSHHEVVWYRRKFTCDGLNGNVLLCFNACDYEADVWVNGYYAIKHIGGYTSFKSDITKYLNTGENVVVVKCKDTLSADVPRGKQSPKFERFGCWYIPTTGIWQSVWLETFKKDCIDDYSLETDIDEGVIKGEVNVLHGVADTLKTTVFWGGEIVAETTVEIKDKRACYCIDLKGKQPIQLWSTNTPNLYYVDFSLLKNEEILDVCHSRFGMRKISIENGKICLNHEPVYQKLVLDQGYWQQTELTPPSAEALKQDILISMQMGFNGARKHQKIEDPYFFYYAEELGFLTWCEMPSGYRWGDELAVSVMREWLEIVRQNKNFTSVIFYAPLNESWGVDAIQKDVRIQNFATSLYYATKSLDPTRLISTNDGWENLNETDVISVHDYAYDDAEFESKYIKGDWNTAAPAGRKQFVSEASYHGQPLLFSEFGGVAMKIDANGSNWGYGVAAVNVEEFYKRIDTLVKGIKNCPFQGYCFTQLTDVQQEVNGLLDEEHTPKFSVEKLFEIFN